MEWPAQYLIASLVQSYRRAEPCRACHGHSIPIALVLIFQAVFLIHTARIHTHTDKRTNYRRNWSLYTAGVGKIQKFTIHCSNYHTAPWWPVKCTIHLTGMQIGYSSLFLACTTEPVRVSITESETYPSSAQNQTNGYLSSRRTLPLLLCWYPFQWPMHAAEGERLTSPWILAARLRYRATKQNRWQFDEGISTVQPSSEHWWSNASDGFVTVSATSGHIRWRLTRGFDCQHEVSY